MKKQVAQVSSKSENKGNMWWTSKVRYGIEKDLAKYYVKAHESE